MAEPRKNHLNIEEAQGKEDEHVATYKPIPESDTDFRSSKASIHKSKEKISADGAEEKLLNKEEEAKIVTRVDMADAKYVVGDHRNGDANIELDANRRQFTGLTKEELMAYADDPFWVRLRWFMFVLFWLLWLSMLVGAVVIIVSAPKCPLPTPRTWYEKGSLIDMSSFDNYGEIESHLPLLQKSKVAGILTYACKDTYQVLEGQESGCIKQFKEFLGKAKEYGVKVIVDVTANFVSKSHNWFQLSENRTDYENYFTWAKGDEYEADDVDPASPNATHKFKRRNNWVSTLNEPAWSWSDKRGEYYLHQFGEDQPDLNFANQEVVKRFDDVINAWMRAGADGIRLHHARELIVDSSLENEKEDTSNVGAVHTEYKYWQHQHTSDQPQLDELLGHWAHMTDGAERVFTIAEETGRAELFLLARKTNPLRPPSAHAVRVAAAAAASDHLRVRLTYWPFLQLIAEPESDESAQAELAIFSLLLPATPVYTLRQLAVQDNATEESGSFEHAAALRQEHVVEHGQLALDAVPAVSAVPAGDAPHLLACVRWKTAHLGYAALYNPGEGSARANLTTLAAPLPAALNVHYVSPAVARATNYTANSVVNIDDVLVPSKATVVLSFVQKKTVDT